MIALRVGQNCVRGKRVLKESVPFYFCQGYTISKDGERIHVDDDKCLDERVYNDYLKERAGNNRSIPQVSIHAIVGKNGSGKSTLVEMMIRLLNNFAASLFGEQITDHYTAHLHYIDKVEGELYYMLGEYAYRLSVGNERKVRLDKYELDNNEYCRVADKYLGEIPVNDMGPILEPFDDGTNIRRFIDAFFYTIVSNYSIYAYNTLDYADENVTEEYERVILREKFKEEEKTKKVPISSLNWLHGLFHKNDGYKTPLVLSPFRNEGNFDINVENTLSRERFISLLLMSNDVGGGGFRTINGHLEVSRFKIKKKNDYSRNYINGNVDIAQISEGKYNELYFYILSRWNEKLFGSDEKEGLEDMAKKKKYGSVALNYLFYKTIKICTKYRDYREYKTVIEAYLHNSVDDTDFFGALDDYIEALIDDRSHITRKIRQTIAYLITPEKYDEYASRKNSIVVGKLAQSARKVLEFVKSNYEYDFYIREIEDVIPPAFLDAKILLKDLKGGSKEPIAFETLSSGEKQQVYSVSSILYHLLNIDSVEEDNSKKRFSYHYVNVILEEIELYFHPDFQKRYISMILDGIAQVEWKNIYGVNICFVTHSPFVLSDIPKSNLLALEDGKSKPQDGLLTFGANIYDMLKSSFFIEGTPIGCYAQWSITRIIIVLRFWRCVAEYPNEKGKSLIKMVSSPKIDVSNLTFLKRYFDDNRWEKGGKDSFETHYAPGKIMKMISQIDEPLVRNSLMREFYDVFPNEQRKELEIKRLERRLLELKVD